ncbi:MAG: hypothetical protein EOO45_23165 [Flavobacterium sp.]|nr:MAG: hypothetical protein EOO45_23165 [Flavobacterium sp.]
MKELKITGGAKIGAFNASWPLAKLHVTRDKFEINVGFMGKYIFLPGDITGITSYIGGYKVGSSGVRITHTIPHYNDLVVFFPRANAAALMQSIADTGFMDNDQLPGMQAQKEVRQLQEQGGFPLKKTAAIIVVALWILMIAAGPATMLLTNDLSQFYLGPLAASTMLITFLVLTLASVPFRDMVLKPGRKLEDIKVFIFFLLIISVLLTVNFSLISHVTAG